MKEKNSINKKGDLELSIRTVLFLILGVILLAIIVGIAVSKIMEGNAAVLSLGASETPLF